MSSGISIASGITAIDPTAYVLPSGGDDTDAIMAAFIAGKGNLALQGGATYYVRPGTVFECQKRWRSDAADTSKGVEWAAVGGKATILPYTPVENSCDYVAVQAFTLSTTTSFRCDAHPFLDGDKVIVEMPNYKAPETGNTVERLSGKTCYIDVIDANNVVLKNDAALTQDINSTGWGAMPAEMARVKLRRYSNTITTNYDCAFLRITGPFNILLGKYEAIMGNTIIGIDIKSSETFAPFYQRQGIGLAIEAMGNGSLGGGDSSPSQGNNFINCEISGWDAAILMDDCTNNLLIGCNLQNNNNALWKAWNVDITTFQQCRFGDDPFIGGQPLQEVSVYAPISFRPNSGPNAPAGASIENYEGCWFMGVLGISLFRSPNGIINGALGSKTNASNIINIKGGYAEQVRRLVDTSIVFNVSGLHIGTFSRDKQLTNNECVIGNYGSQQRSQVDLTGITVESSGTTPLNGWVYVGDQIDGNERYVPITTVNSSFLFGNFLRNNNGRRLILLDGVNQSDQASGSGFYQFEGMVQVAGKTRSFKRTEAAATPSFTAELFDQGMQHIVAGIAGNLTINNPSTDANTTATYAADFGAGNRGLYRLRGMPLEFFVTQDAVGGRTVTFGSDFVVNGANAASGGANTSTYYKFVFSPSDKWVQVSPAAVWS